MLLLPGSRYRSGKMEVRTRCCRPAYFSIVCSPSSFIQDKVVATKVEEKGGEETERRRKKENEERGELEDMRGKVRMII